MQHVTELATALQVLSPASSSGCLRCNIGGNSQWNWVVSWLVILSSRWWVQKAYREVTCRHLMHCIFIGVSIPRSYWWYHTLSGHGSIMFNHCMHQYLYGVSYPTICLVFAAAQPWCNSDDVMTFFFFVSSKNVRENLNQSYSPDDLFCLFVPDYGNKLILIEFLPFYCALTGLGSQFHYFLFQHLIKQHIMT